MKLLLKDDDGDDDDDDNDAAAAAYADDDYDDDNLRRTGWQVVGVLLREELDYKAELSGWAVTPDGVEYRRHCRRPGSPVRPGQSINTNFYRYIY